MKTPYKNIYEILKLNRFVTISVTVMAFLSSMFSGMMVYKTYKEAMHSAFAVNTDGSVIPLKLVTQRQNLEVEALAHLEHFHQYFYGIDPSNLDNNLEKALWLGDSSVDNAYRQKKADGIYNRILQYSLVQRVVQIESELDLQQEPYAFRTVSIFEIKRGSSTDWYELTTTGNLLHVDRNYPRNTHGLLITNFFESSLRKLNPSVAERKS